MAVGLDRPVTTCSSVNPATAMDANNTRGSSRSNGHGRNGRDDTDDGDRMGPPGSRGSSGGARANIGRASRIGDYFTGLARGERKISQVPADRIGRPSLYY